MKSRKQRIVNWLIRFLMVASVTSAAILLIIIIEGIK